MLSKEFISSPTLDVVESRIQELLLSPLWGALYWRLGKPHCIPPLANNPQSWVNKLPPQIILPVRDDICHKHHKQRLCKIITFRVKFYFVDVF